eukprot:1737274-Prymnesium_polylepis.1
MDQASLSVYPPAEWPECTLLGTASLAAFPQPPIQHFRGRPYSPPRNWSRWFRTECACRNSAAAIRSQQSRGLAEPAGGPLSPWPFTCRYTYSVPGHVLGRPAAPSTGAGGRAARLLACVNDAAAEALLAAHSKRAGAHGEADDGSPQPWN